MGEPKDARLRALRDAGPTLSDDPAGVRSGRQAVIPGPPRLPRDSDIRDVLTLDFDELRRDTVDDLTAVDRGWTIADDERPTLPCPTDERPSGRPTIPVAPAGGEEER